MVAVPKMAKYTFTEPDSWLRHMQRKLELNGPYQARQMFNRMGKELYLETIKQMSGAVGQPQGYGRLGWLKESDNPFAQRHGMPMAQTPPVGYITGQLLGSIRFNTFAEGGLYSVSTSSVGVPYAKFILSDEGTSKMLGRGIKQEINTFALGLSHQFAKDLAAWLRDY